MTVSVASSPTFFRIASGRARRGATRRIFPVARFARFDHIRETFEYVAHPPVHFLGIPYHRVDRHPAPILQLLEEAAVPARVTRDSTALLDLEQNHVLVAVQAESRARSGRFPTARPFSRDARASATSSAPRRSPRSFRATRVHPCERQHVVRRHFLGDRGHQALLVHFTLSSQLSIVATPAFTSVHEIRGWRRPGMKIPARHQHAATSLQDDPARSPRRQSDRTCRINGGR